MTSRKIKKVKLEDQFDEEEEDVASVMEVSDNGEGARVTEGEVDEERTLVKHEAKKKPYMLKTPDEKAATIARAVASSEAVSWIPWRN